VLPHQRVYNNLRISEKFLAWTDKDPPLETIFEAVTLYWLTETFPRCIYAYRTVRLNLPDRKLHLLTGSQNFLPDDVGGHGNPKWYIKKPFGYSYFPKELAPIPKSWVETTGDLVFFRAHESVSSNLSVEI
jgi:microsomal epoxide hydrolase